MDFDLLPLEIKYHILSYLDQRTLTTKASSVSRYWNNLCQSPYLQKEIVITTGNVDEDIVEKLRTHCRIRKISFFNTSCWNWTSKVQNTFRCLRRVVFKNCVFLTTDFPKSKSLSECFPLVKEVEINISNHLYIKSLLVFAEHCKELTELTVEGDFFTNDDDNLFGKFLEARGNNLEKLKIDCYILIKPAYQLLRNCPRLIHLELRRNFNMTDIELSYLKELSNLKVLCVGETFRTTETGILNFLENTKFACLTSLNFRFCWNFTDQCLLLIANRYPSLKKLDVSQCRLITDSGIINMIKICTNIEELSLRSTEITRKCLKEISTTYKISLSYI